MLTWCERHDVGYIAGIAQNQRLNALTAQWQQEAASDFERSDEKIRWFYQLCYAAKSWSRHRKIIAKIEHADKGSNPRRIVTNLIWWANQFRLLLFSLVYILLETIRRVALNDAEPGHVYVNTLRLKL